MAHCWRQPTVAAIGALVAQAAVPGTAAATTAQTPSAPTGVVAVAHAASAKVSWKAAATNGSPITSYTVTSSPTAKTCTATGTLSCTVTGLANGDTYSFRVRATNGAGTGPTSTPSNTVEPQSVPGAPTGLKVTPANAVVKVSWSAPPANGTAITRYNVISTPTGKTCTATTNLSCTVLALTNGTSYTFRVSATNGRGAGPTSTPSVAVVPASPPTTAPVLISTTAESGAIALTWKPVSPTKDGGAAITGYVARAEIGTTVKSSKSVGSTATSATVTGLTNGTAYRVTVSATNSAGTGPPATSGEITPVGIPGQPVDVLAQAADQSVEVIWTPATASGTKVTGYTVTSSPTDKSCHSTGSTCYVSGLTNGVAYSFTVHATNGKGTGPTSTPTVMVTPGLVPDAPPAPTAAAGNQQAQVTWTAATGNGASVTAYTVISNPTSKTCSTTGALTCVVPGLDNGKAYTFRVRATNDVGLGPSSAASAPVIPSTVPGAPTDVTASFGNESVTVGWKDPSTNGTKIVSYTATSTPTNRSCTVTGATATSCTVKNLVNGDAYSFRVRAKNGDGTGPTSTSSSSVVPATAPTVAPSVLGLVSITTTLTVRVQRLPVADDGGNAVTAYVVKATGTLLTKTKKSYSRSLTFLTKTTKVGGTSRALSITGLPYGVSLKVTVTARNTVGSSPTATAGSIVLKSVPAAPLTVNATAAFESAEVTWYDPADLIPPGTAQVVNDADNGTAITSYTVTSTPTGLTCTTSSNDCYVPGLRNGVSYTFTVKAHNGQGTGPPSKTSNAVVPTTLPDAPGSITATPHNGAVTTTWSASSTSHGSAITRYVVTATSSLETCSTPGTLTCTVTGLANGSSYAFRVRAVTAKGDGPRSSSSNVVIPYTVPSAPTITTVTAGNQSVTVKWSAAATNGRPISSYTVTSTPTGEHCTASGGTAKTFSCTVNTLANGVTYTFRVHGTNAAGTGPTSKPLSAVPYSAPTAAPTIVATSTSGGSITVTWSTLPVADDGGQAVTRYAVKAVLGGSVKKTDTATPASTTATISGLTNGTSYEIELAAANSAGPGPTATRGGLTPSTVPGPPLNPVAEAGNGDALVIWTAAVNNGTPVSGYTVTSTPGTFTCTSVTLTCYVAGLTDGTSYKFAVRATNGRGTGPTGTLTAAVKPATLPSAPTAATAAAHPGAATVSWTAPSTDGGSAVKSYTVTSKPTGKTCTTSTLGCQVTGLANGTTYTFRVRATNTTGAGPASAPSNPATPSLFPTAPTKVSATASAGKAKVTWAAATPNGTPVIKYTVVSTPGAITCTTTKVTTLSCTVSGLTDGTAYVFRVKASNKQGAGPLSTPSNAVIPYAPPLVGPVITGESSTNRSVSVTWDDVPVATDGGEAITGYVVDADIGGTEKATATVAPTATTAKLSNLVNGTTYTVTVAAQNPKGTGPATTAAATLVPSTVPGAPTDVDATPGNGSAAVVWTAPGNGGSPITGYTVTSTPGDKVCQTTGATTCVVTGLTNGVTYSFVVVATNVRGNGPTSTTSNTVKPEDLPGAPTHVAATALNKAASVIWTAPATVGGSALTGFLVTSTPTTKTCTTSGATSCTVSGLKNGVIYSFRVRAQNTFGYGPSSAASNAVTPFASPGAPLNVVATAESASAKVAWTPPAVIVTAITGYIVTSDPGGQTCTTTGALSCTVSGLTDGDTYTFSVRAETSFGTGPASESSNPVVPTAPSGKPGQPGKPTAVAGNAKARVSWTAPSTDGSPITRYIVTSSPSGKTCTTTGALACTVTGLTNGTSYTFTVKARNANGTGPTSVASSPVTPEGTATKTTTPTTTKTTKTTGHTTPVTSGYDLVGQDGGVFVFSPPGTKGGFYGSLPGLKVSVHNIVGMVPTANDQGYFLVGSDGGVFAFGNAPFLGSLPGLHVTPREPITGIVPTGTDQGYFLVGQDGGVFAFGNAPFLGSLPSRGINVDNIIGIAATPSGNGYWLVSATGTVYAFGAAQQFASATHTSSPVSAIAGTPSGGGYWVVTQSGQVLAFGDAQSFKTLPDLKVKPALPVIGIVHTADTAGYWLIGADGGIFAFGDAGFVGSLPGVGVHVTDIVGAVPTKS